MPCLIPLEIKTIPKLLTEESLNKGLILSTNLIFSLLRFGEGKLLSVIRLFSLTQGYSRQLSKQRMEIFCRLLIKIYFLIICYWFKPVRFSFASKLLNAHSHQVSLYAYEYFLALLQYIRPVGCIPYILPVSSVS